MVLPTKVSPLALAELFTEYSFADGAAGRTTQFLDLGRRHFHRKRLPSGERAAAIYTLIGMAKLNGADQKALLRHVLAQIADHPVNRVDEFLP